MDKILVVDDSKVARSVIKGLLEAEGFDVSEAVDGVDALDTFNGDSFSLIITDVNMPNMDGIEFSKNVRQINPSIPIIVITTESSQKIKEQGKESGVNAWIVKPTIDKGLIPVVKKLLQKS